MAGRDHDLAADEKKTRVRFVGAAAGIASGECLHRATLAQSPTFWPPGSGLTKVGMGHG